MTKHEVTGDDVVGIADEQIALGATLAIDVNTRRARVIRPPCTDPDCGPCFEHGVPVIKVTMSGVTPEAVKTAVEATIQDVRRPSDATHVGGEATVVPRWRVGRTLGRTIYYDDLLIGMVDTEAAAKRIVEAMNAPPQEPEVLFCDRCGRDHDEAGILSQVEVCRSCEASDAYEIDLCRSTIEELVLALRFTSPVEHPAMHEAWRRGKAFLDARRTNSAPPRETCDCGACAICQSMPTGPELAAELARERASRCHLSALGHTGANAGKGCVGCDAAARRDFEKHIGPIGTTCDRPTSATAAVALCTVRRLERDGTTSACFREPGHPGKHRTAGGAEWFATWDRASDASPRCPHCRYCSLTCAQHAERSTDYDQAEQLYKLPSDKLVMVVLKALVDLRNDYDSANDHRGMSVVDACIVAARAAAVRETAQKRSAATEEKP